MILNTGTPLGGKQQKSPLHDRGGRCLQRLRFGSHSRVRKDSCPSLGYFRLKDHSLAGLAVHHDAQRLGELQVADAALFFYSGLLGQPWPVDRALASVGINGEVSDLEGGQVLKEGATLRRRDPEVVEASFHDGTGSGDFIPFDRDAEPRIVRTPAADTDPQIRAILRAQGGVEVSHCSCDLLTTAALEALRIDDDDIVQVFDSAVAENLRALADHTGRVHVAAGEIFAA